MKNLACGNQTRLDFTSNFRFLSTNPGIFHQTISTPLVCCCRQVVCVGRVTRFQTGVQWFTEIEPKFRLKSCRKEWNFAMKNKTLGKPFEFSALVKCKIWKFFFYQRSHFQQLETEPFHSLKSCISWDSGFWFRKISAMKIWNKSLKSKFPYFV